MIPRTADHMVNAESDSRQTALRHKLDTVERRDHVASRLNRSLNISAGPLRRILASCEPRRGSIRSTRCATGQPEARPAAST